MVPFRIQAQVLRRWPPAGHANTVGPFAIMSDDTARPSDEASASRKGRWRQSDVKRAIAAAEQAGLESYRVEIAPDGTLSIIVGAPEETADPGRCGDDVLR